MNIYRKYFSKYKLPFLFAMLCLAFEAGCDLMQPTIMARIIDQGIRNHQAGIVIQLGLIMLMITAFGAIFAASRNYIASKVSQSFGADLRHDVFTKIIHFSEISVDKIESGSLITRMTNDTSQVVRFINGIMRIFIKAPITCIGSIILAYILSPRLTYILFLVVSIVSFMIFISMKLSYVRFAKVQAAIDKVNTTVQEYLMGIRLVKAFGRFDDELNKFDSDNTALTNKSISSQLVVAYFSPLMSLTVSLGIAAVIFFGSRLFINGEIEVGKIAAYISYMAQILVSLIMITNVFNTFVRTKASSERIREVLDSQEDSKGTVKMDKQTSGELAFDKVTFAYPHGSGLPVLKNISFTVGDGETLAVIGPTGSGKSTLAWLCLRFYEVSQGSIKFNATDISRLETESLRENIAIAPQKSMLFTGTIAENILWGNAQASQEDIIGAARISQANEFIQNLPEKYDTLLGQGGVNLSGGQKQRVSIARALVKKAPILILDDCTSALDAVTEARVRQGLHSLTTTRTMILITQRIGTAMSADKILVLDNGENVGLGTHRELLKSCKTYQDIYESQIGSNVGGGKDGR